MPLRELEFPRDLQAVLDIAAESFQYPDNPEWSIQEDEAEGLTESIQKLRRIWPIINLMQIFSPALLDTFRGHIWEDDGRPAGLVMIQRRGSTDTWYIGTVAVHPDSRRRGIARKLVMASIDLMRERDGRIALLDVISGNLPAHNLYKSIGFEHFTGNISFKFKTKSFPSKPTLPEDYYQEELAFSDWQSRYDLESKISPEQITKYEPVEVGRFKRPFALRLALPLIFKAQGMRTMGFVLKKRENNDIVARGQLDRRTRPGGRHSIFMRLDPDHELLASCMVDYLLDQVAQIDSDHLTNLSLPQWQPELIPAAKQAGFEERIESHRLGLLL